MPTYYADRRFEVFCGFYKKSSVTYVIFLREKHTVGAALFILYIYELNIIPIMMILSHSVNGPILDLFLLHAS